MPQVLSGLRIWFCHKLQCKFQMVWVPCACGQLTVNFVHLVGFQYLQNSSKDMVPDIIYSP